MIMETSQKNLAPDASDAAFRDIFAFFGLHQSHPALDEYLSRFEMARRRAEARLPNGGRFPDTLSSSLRLRNAGLTPNQKSVTLSSTGGDPPLEVMKRHICRFSKHCGAKMKQDALLAMGDLLKARQNSSRSDANKALRDKTFVGDAQVAPKKKRIERKKARAGPPQLLRRMAPRPIRLTPVRVIATGAADAGANSICFRIARGNNRMPRDKCLFR